MIRRINSYFSQLPPLNRFVALAGLMTILFYAYTLCVHYLPPFTRFASLANTGIRTSLIRLTATFLKLLGYPVTCTSQVVGIEGSTPIFMAPLCFAWRSMYVFAAFILIYPGNLKHKLIFIAAGLLIIHFSNSIRIGLLAIANHHKHTFIKPFLHKYLIKGFIFALWLIWLFVVNREKQLT